MSDCVFCQIVRGEAPAAKIYEDDDVLAFLDIFPVSRFHTLVIPKIHYKNFLDVPPTLLSKVNLATQKIALVYREHLGLNNFHFLTNCGSQAQQDVFHLHLHIIPRHLGDGNNVIWQKHPEFRGEFDAMIGQLPKIA